MNVRERVNDLLSLWERRRNDGETVSAEDLCRDAPELLDEVRRQINALRAFDSHIPSVTPAPGDTASRPTVPPSDQPPDIPGYEILAVLGQGGMGIVYKAVQTRLKRVVALKMIRSGRRATAADLERFRAEAEAIARLQHPNIVQVYEVGEYDGQPYFSLEFVAGGSLDRQLDGTPMDEHRAAELVATLATAIHAAHTAGVVHRDLKPANILLASGGGLASGGREPPDVPSTGGSRPPLAPEPKITDFGLAKQLDADSGQTATGTVLGTPSYMAPEQAAGKVKEVGPAADVYALGAIFYELLSGRPPFRGATPWETVSQVIADDPVPPSRLRPRLSRDLETICLKCMEKDPARRYASAAALADDLRRFLAHEPILARPTSAWVRWAKWARRRPTAAALLAALGVGLPTLLVLLVVSLREAEKRAAAVQDLTAARSDLDQLRVEREAEKRRLGDLRRERRRTEYALDMGVGLGLWDRADVLGLRGVLAKYNTTPDAEDLRGFEWYYLRQLTQAHLYWLRHATIPDGEIESLWRHLKEKWDFASYPELAALGHPWGYHPTTHRLAAGDRQGRVLLFDTQAEKPLPPLIGHTGNVVAVAFSPDGKLLASAGADRTVRVWELASMKEVLVFRGHADVLTGVGFSPDGNLVASRSADRVGLVLEVRTGKVVFRLPEYVTGTPALSADGAWVAAGVDDKSNDARVWAVATGTEWYSLRGHGAPVDAVAFPASFGPDYQWVATASRDRTVKMWQAGKDRVTYCGHDDPPVRLAFSPDGNRLASATAGGEVLVWDATRAPEYRVMRPDQKNAHRTAVAVVASSPDGGYVLTANADWFGESHVKVWQPRTGKMLLQLRIGERPAPAFPDVLLGAALSSDGKTCAFAAGSPDRPQDPADVRLFRVETKTEGVAIPSPQSLPHAVAFSLDGTLLAVATIDRTVSLFEVATGKPAGTLPAVGVSKPIPEEREIGPMKEERRFRHYPGPGSVAFSPDGTRIAAAHPDGTITVWQRDRPTEPVRLAGHAARVNTVAFSPDGRFLASAADEPFVRLWDTTDGRQVFAFTGHRGLVSGVAFSPDGKRLASGGDDGTVRLWDPATGQEVFTLRSNAVAVRSVAFRSDGRALVTGHGDGAVRVWYAGPEPPRQVPDKP